MKFVKIRHDIFEMNSLESGMKFFIEKFWTNDLKYRSSMNSANQGGSTPTD